MTTQTEILPFLQMLLAMFWPQAPILLVSLAALIIIVVGRSKPTA